MFSYEILQDYDIVSLSSIGQVTFEDYQTTMPALMAEVREQGISKLLLDHRKHDGPSTKKAWSISFDALKEARGLFEKIAFVSRDTKEAGEVLEYFERAGKDIRQFETTQFDKALAWLKGNSEDGE